MSRFTITTRKVADDSTNHRDDTRDVTDMCVCVVVEHRVSTKYSIRNDCGTKEDLPELSPEEWDEIQRQDRMNPGGIEQV